MVTTSAPGKLMLFGEHAVVHKRPCLVMSVDSRMNVSLNRRKDGKINLNAPDLKIKDYCFPLVDLKNSHPKETQFVLAAIKNFFEKYKIKSGLEIKTKSKISSKYGLGSSSAVTVSTIKGLAELFKIKITKKELFDLSYKTVLDIQGVGSGFDVAAAVYGGILYFIIGGKTIEEIRAERIPILVGYTGIKADTPTLVKMISKRLLNEPKKINKIFDEIKKIVDLAKVEIENSNWKRVGELMNLNQDLLRDLGVSSEKLEDLIKAALKAGAWGAKLSGAGGGDCIITMAEKENYDKIKKAIEKAGGKIISVKFPAEGVKILG